MKILGAILTALGAMGVMGGISGVSRFDLRDVNQLSQARGGFAFCGLMLLVGIILLVRRQPPGNNRPG